MNHIPLITTVKEDISAFFNQEDMCVFCNECDFQMHLALYLQESNHYDDVDVEYLIPHHFLSKLADTYEERKKLYPWLRGENQKTDTYLDIVVKRGNDFLPIELKFSTKRYIGTLNRLGILVEDAEILRNQGAQDLTMYNTWKDVRRLEVMKKLSPNSVKNGLSVLLTNDALFLKPRNPNTKTGVFSLAPNTSHTTKKHWQMSESIMKNHPSFEVDKEYTTIWEKTSFHPDGIPNNQIPFYYCIIEV